MASAAERVELRRAAAPTAIRYPAELPVTERREDLLAALRDNQVVVVAGETGSGKSTQLPKLCLELGRGVDGLIGHTQPRRLAARSIAERVASELNTAVGDVVGFTMRFTDRVSDRTLVKVMTDGILLAEIQRDRNLRRYDTLIIDEAHERSLNVDFLLGYLKQLLPRRPDLKLIITSATIDTERFSQHFDGAPVVEVSGRTYPVEVRYRPVADEAADSGRDQVQAICDAVEELSAEGPGDILVFLSGEREIRDAADALGEMDLHLTEILPLYARLSAAEQHRVFAPHSGRRIVLATNVAETSLTVPGIRYVIDPGTARISRYNRRTKVQRLPIEAISQASANQRAGRCGRVAPGICIRLYSKEDFEARPEFTDPEILRTNLASVILQMAAIGLGDVAAFPFVEAPDRRSVADGMALLEELDALHPADKGAPARLTPVGRRLAQLPVDPRLGRMILGAEKRGCVKEVMVIAAALSIQDPRERPSDNRAAADEMHARFKVEGSDFLAFLELWDYVRERQRALSSNQFRKQCRAEYLHFLRVREWQDVYSQLLEVVRGMKIHVNRDRADPDSVHRALLAGLLSHVGLYDDNTRDYRGARNARFVLSPGSSLAKKKPRWVMAAELVETTRLFAHTAALIRPEWIEEVGRHLVKRAYDEPHWDRRQGAAVAFERVSLFGLPVVSGRRVAYSRIDPEHARDLFIAHALMEGDWDTHHAFMEHNRQRRAELAALEDRCRRRDLQAADEVVFDFFDRRLPADIASARAFDRWWRDARAENPAALDLSLADLVDPEAGAVDLGGFPDTWPVAGRPVPLTYVFDPTADDDGVTAHVPLDLLDALPAGLDWHIAGLRTELVTSLLRTLPKEARRHFSPAADHAEEFLRQVEPEQGRLIEVLARHLSLNTGLTIRPSDFHPEHLAPYLLVRWQAEDGRGRVVAAGRDLQAVRNRVSRTLRAAVARAGHPVERDGLTTWDIGELPRTVEFSWGGQVIAGYPALVDEGDTVAVRVLPTAADQEVRMWAGTRRLLQLTIPFPRKHLRDRLTNRTKAGLSRAPHDSPADLLDDCAAAAIDELMAAAGGPAWDEPAWKELHDFVRRRLGDHTYGVVVLVGRILETRAAIEERMSRLTLPALKRSVDDVAAQVERLVFPGFVTATGGARLPDLLRYLRAAEHRLDGVLKNPVRDRRHTDELHHLEEELGLVRSATDKARLRWLLEELRVGLFAQQLGTPVKVSVPRVLREIQSAQ